MPAPSPQAAFTLTLSGSTWYISAGDEIAAPYVTTFGEIMSLAAAPVAPVLSDQENWRELRVLTDPCAGSKPAGSTQAGPLFCLLRPPADNDSLRLGTSLIALAIARAELARGGLLIHGALAAAPPHIGGSIILAGPAEVGKTTASNRLPPPWRSRSDDATLVVRDPAGSYIAHPWPTWSRLFNPDRTEPAPLPRWDVQNGTTLRAVCFLAQAQEDRIEPVPAAPAAAYLMETVQIVSSLMTWDLPEDRIPALRKDQLTAVEALVRTIPAYRLHLSLHGAFWTILESTLAPQPGSSAEPAADPARSGPLSLAGRYAPQAFLNPEAITVCYTGTSMFPTLRAPDILEVLPSPGTRVRQGDVVYFAAPHDGQKIIHRVVRVTAEGVYTRGDNSQGDDPDMAPHQHIIGRVAAAWRYGRYRPIAGGPAGILTGYRCRFGRRLRTLLAPLVHGIYHLLADRGLLRLLLPVSLTPRIFSFRHRYQPPILKLMVKGRMIGHYDADEQCWKVDRFWRIFVDMAGLPILPVPTPPAASGSDRVEIGKTETVPPLP